MKPKVILITGASRGFGAACASHLFNTGNRVYGTSRSAPDFREIEIPPHGKPCKVLIPMDVTSMDSVSGAVEFIIKNEGRLDVVINNAGYGLGGAIQDTSVEEGKALFDTNLWGVLRVCRETLPHMRKQGSGYLINIGSLGGSLAVPFQGLYCTSKHALRGMTDSLRMEVKGFGIHVVLVEPGDARTGFTSNRICTVQSKTNPVYREAFKKALHIIEEEEKNGLQPQSIARIVGRILKSSRPRACYTAAPFIQLLAFRLKYILPGNLFDAIIRDHYS